MAGALANFILIPVIAFYLLRDYHAMWPRFEAMIPRRSVDRVRALRAEMDSALSGFVRGQLTVASILGALHAIGLSIVGIDGAVVIGLLSGFLNMVPYVGTALGISLALLMAVLSFSGWAPILGVIVVFAVANTIESLVITPRIVGDKTGLSPVVVMLAILTGGEVFGFAGLLLGVPAAAVLKVLLRVMREVYVQSDAYRGGTPGMATAPAGEPNADPAASSAPRPRKPSRPRKPPIALIRERSRVHATAVLRPPPSVPHTPSAPPHRAPPPAIAHPQARRTFDSSRDRDRPFANHDRIWGVEDVRRHRSHR